MEQRVIHTNSAMWLSTEVVNWSSHPRRKALALHRSPSVLVESQMLANTTMYIHNSISVAHSPIAQLRSITTTSPITTIGSTSYYHLMEISEQSSTQQSSTVRMSNQTIQVAGRSNATQAKSVLQVTTTLGWTSRQKAKPLPSLVRVTSSGVHLRR